jgi:dethiobiotin synthetase
MTRGYFVTGTDTGVGKTRVAAGLIALLRGQGRRVAGMKPVASGCVATPGGLRNEDALALIEASGLDLPYDWVNPYAFAPPIAPHIAAAGAGQTIRFAPLKQALERLHSHADCVVVEGVGGWRVPLGPDGDVADLAKALGLPVVLVVGLRLGCLNHAALTWADLRRDGVLVSGWVASAVDPDFERATENLAALGEIIAAPCLGVVEHKPAASPGDAAAGLRLPAPASANGP